MGALDPEKILMVLVVALIVLGPERLPKVARQLGAAWRQLLSYREKVEAEVRAAIPDLDLPKIPRSPAAAVSGFITGLTTEAKSTINGNGRPTRALTPDSPEALAAGHDDADGADVAPAGSEPAATIPAASSPTPESTAPAASAASAAGVDGGRPAGAGSVRTGVTFGFDDPSMN